MSPSAASPFVDWQEPEPQVWLSFIQVSSDQPCFAGHFPTMPILPGAVLIQWAIQAAAQLGLAEPPCQGVKGVKFKQTVMPGENLSLKLWAEPAGNKVGFLFAKGDQEAALGHLLYG